MTVDDIEVMGAAMAQSLASSDAVRLRPPDAPRWVVSIDKVLNLSSDVMTESEQWAIMARLRASAPITAMWDQHNIRFVIPPERAAQLRASDNSFEFARGFGSQREVTHTMTATFRSVTRAQADRRTDLYYCEFALVDLRDGAPVWNDRFEYKRAARGAIWD